MAAAVTTDEIYKRYLDKAIKEILRLEHEVAAGGGRRARRPADRPSARRRSSCSSTGRRRRSSQEGVAFHGRAGHALKRSLERLHVDPREVFGTNCVKFAGADMETSPRPGCGASCGSSQPKLVVVMGEDALAFVNELAFPLARAARRDARASCSASRRRSRRSSCRTSTRRSTSRPRRRASGTRSSRSAPWWAAAAAVLDLGAALAAATASRGTRLAPHVGRRSLWPEHRR